MPRGGARVNAGRPAKPIADHIRRNTYRPDRHGPRPATVLAMPPPAAPPWTPTPAELETQGKAGRAFVRRMLDRYGFTAAEGELLLEAGHAVSALAAVRSVSRQRLALKDLAALERIELGWSRQFAALLGALKVSA